MASYVNIPSVPLPIQVIPFLGFEYETQRISPQQAINMSLAGMLPIIVNDITSGDVTITFCCRQDGNVTEPATLPFDSPFVLIPVSYDLK